MLSIIIPAHNESAVIRRLLMAVTSGALPGELETIVVCNGCTDDTAGIARSFGYPVQVIETDRRGKSHALNIGDDAARGFPRFYIDADIVISLRQIRMLAARLDQGDVLAVAPRAEIELEGCSRFVRAFFEIRNLLPSAREGIGGSGVYAVSEKGRRRFGRFPTVTADDGYVRLQFGATERETLQTVHSRVFAPRKVRDLILTKTRAHYGTYELESRFPELLRNRGQRNHETLARLWRSPKLWPQLVVYIYVTAVARWRAVLLLRAKNMNWARDDTSRVAA